MDSNITTICSTCLILCMTPWSQKHYDPYWVFFPFPSLDFFREGNRTTPVLCCISLHGNHGCLVNMLELFTYCSLRLMEQRAISSRDELGFHPWARYWNRIGGLHGHLYLRKKGYGGMYEACWCGKCHMHDKVPHALLR